MGDEADYLDDGADYCFDEDECPVLKCCYNEDGCCDKDIYERCPHDM